MKMGLITETIFNRSVKKILKFYNDNNECAFSGRNCAFFDIKGELILSKSYCSSFKMFSTVSSVISSINELIINDITPIAVNLCLIMPEKYSEEKMTKILEKVQVVLDKSNVTVYSFTGEVVSYVKEPVLTCTSIGSSKSELNHKTKADDDIVIIGNVAQSGASILASGNRDELLKRLSDKYIDEAIYNPETFLISKELIKLIYNIPEEIESEAALAVKSEDACIYHVSEGGIYATLWNMAKESKVGLDIFLKDIPIRQESVEVCNFLDINPYELFSEGCLLVTIKDGQKLVDRLSEKGFKANKIGKATDSNDKVIIIDSDRKFITKPSPDELTKYM